jgi:DNA-3-methyladenine glycosylase II
MWTGWAGPDRTALHTLMLSTLAWGSHSRTDSEDTCSN